MTGYIFPRNTQLTFSVNVVAMPKNTLVKVLLTLCDFFQCRSQPKNFMFPKTIDLHVLLRPLCIGQFKESWGRTFSYNIRNCLEKAYSGNYLFVFCYTLYFIFPLNKKNKRHPLYFEKRVLYFVLFFLCVNEIHQS